MEEPTLASPAMAAVNGQRLAFLGAREDLTARLSEIRCPALLIHGENDAAIPVERARDLTRLLGGAEERSPFLAPVTPRVSPTPRR